MELVHSRQSPNPASRELLAYRCLLALLSPLIMSYSLVRAARDGGRDYLAQRLGYRLPKLQRPVWIHCASVGEVNAVAPLLQLIFERYPNTPLLVTTNTPTGREMLRKRMGQRYSHVFMPLDFKRAVKRFIGRFNPRAALFFETELWPNAFDCCANRGIPLVIINGRLSDRTLKAPAWLQRLYQHCLRHTRAILARSETDSKRFISLGARPGQVFTIGNIKFAQGPNSTSESSANPVGRPYWLAASTHHDEELRLARIWKAKSLRENLLVIAPRHPGAPKQHPESAGPAASGSGVTQPQRSRNTVDSDLSGRHAGGDANLYALRRFCIHGWVVGSTRRPEYHRTCATRQGGHRGAAYEQFRR